MRPLEKKLLESLRGHGLVKSGDAGLLLVSGGRDSMALLHAMHAVSEPLSLRLEVAAFDHGLRSESAGEARWVRQQAQALGLQTHLRQAEGLGDLKSGVQAAARHWRREETEKLLAERKLDWAATGHQQDDHLETWLLKWLRGAHIGHLRGMQRRAAPYIRPLLDFSRRQLTEYLREMGQDWKDDPSNDTVKYKRNKVRHQLLPLLQELSGGALARRLGEMEQQSRELEALLEKLIADAPDLETHGQGEARWVEAHALAALSVLAALSPLVAGEWLHGFIQAHLPGQVDYATLSQAVALLGNTGGGASGNADWELHLSGGRLLKRRGERLMLMPAPVGDANEGNLPVVVTQGSLTLCVAPTMTVTIAGNLAEAAKVEDKAADAPWLEVFNIAAGSALELRWPRPGDRFHPPGKPRPLKLADFFRERGVPSWQREATPLLLCAGEVIAVYPLCAGKGHHQQGETREGSREKDRGKEAAASGETLCLRVY